MCESEVIWVYVTFDSLTYKIWVSKIKLGCRAVRTEGSGRNRGTAVKIMLVSLTSCLFLHDV